MLCHLLFQRDDLPTVRNLLEEIRSETNEVLAENIHDYEMEESCRFGELEKQWEGKPDDSELFFRSEEHKGK